MKFYLIVLIEEEGKDTSKAIYEYDSYDAALSRYHKELGGWMSKSNVAHILCMVTNSEGGIYKNEAWTAPVVDEVTE